MKYINEKKLNVFKNLGYNDFFVITDFDHTLTTPESETSVGLISYYIGGELFEKRIKLFNYYRPLELDYNINYEDKKKLMKEWAQKSFETLKEYITEEIVNEAVKNANIFFRDGVKKFLKDMYDNNVPVIVMSAGVGNVVRKFLEKESCLFENMTIVSNFFDFKEAKATIDLNNIMATSNKEYIKIPEKIRKEIDTKSNALLFGDLIEDLKMMDSEKLKNTLTFGFLDIQIEENLKRYQENFDIVLTENEVFNNIDIFLCEES